MRYLRFIAAGVLFAIAVWSKVLWEFLSENPSALVPAFLLVAVTIAHAYFVWRSWRLQGWTEVCEIMRDEVFPRQDKIRKLQAEGKGGGDDIRELWRGLSYAAERVAWLCEKGLVEKRWVVSFHPKTFSNMWEELGKGIISRRKEKDEFDLGKELQQLARACDKHLWKRRREEARKKQWLKICRRAGKWLRNWLRKGLRIMKCENCGAEITFSMALRQPTPFRLRCSRCKAKYRISAPHTKRIFVGVCLLFAALAVGLVEGTVRLGLVFFVPFLVLMVAIWLRLEVWFRRYISAKGSLTRIDTTEQSPKAE